MSNKTQLQSNNETLASILSNVLGLPAQVDPLSDTDLIPENIREGVDVWGVVGTMVEGKAGIDFGEVTLASAATSVTVSHNLDVVPSFVALIPIAYSYESYSTYFNFNGYVGNYVSSSRIGMTEITNTITNTQITFNSLQSNYPFKATTYKWVAIA